MDTRLTLLLASGFRSPLHTHTSNYTYPLPTGLFSFHWEALHLFLGTLRRLLANLMGPCGHPPADDIPWGLEGLLLLLVRGRSQGFSVRLPPGSSLPGKGYGGLLVT